MNNKTSCLHLVIGFTAIFAFVSISYLSMKAKKESEEYFKQQWLVNQAGYACVYEGIPKGNTVTVFLDSAEWVVIEYTSGFVVEPTEPYVTTGGRKAFILRKENIK